VIDLGDVAHLSVDVTDRSGALVDTTMTLAITLPDLTSVTPAPTPTHEGLGKYSYDFATAGGQVGEHHGLWTGTNPAFRHEEIFHVEAASSIAIVSMFDMKRQLRISTNLEDDDLRGWILSASENIDGYIGACAPRAVVEETVVNYGTSLWLSTWPVIALQSIDPALPSQTTFQVSDLIVKKATGEIRRVDGGLFAGDYGAHYTAGRSPVPHSARDATEIIVQHLYGSRKGVAVVPTQGGAAELVTLPGWSYAIPARAAELLRWLRHDQTVMS
jgi:hypothetical protein